MKLEKVPDVRSPAPPSGVVRAPQLKALTSIRFFAALHVALYHLVRPFTLWGVFEPVMRAGYVGVSFFFVLSGFILTYSHAQEYESGKGQPTSFWMARFARIYPVYLLSMLFAGYVRRSQFKQHVHILAYIADLFMVQSWSVRLVNFFNVPAWSISDEVFFYLVFPFVVHRLRPASYRKAILAIGVLWIFAILAPGIMSIYNPAAWLPEESVIAVADRTNWMLRLIRLPAFALPEFLSGISLAWLYLFFRPSRRIAFWMVMFALVSLLLILMLADHLPRIMLHNGLLIPVFAMLILGLCEANWFSRLLAYPVLVLLGEASFALYMFHFLYNDWIDSFGTPDDSIRGAFTKLAVIIPLSVAVHLFVERPCRRLIVERWRRRLKASANLAHGLPR